MKICYTAIFGDHKGQPYDDLKEPTVITPGWKYICFTDQSLTSDIWEIRKMDVFEDPQRTARWVKIMAWVDWEYSMWIDAAFQINVDLNDWWERKHKMPFSCAKHPLRTCVYREVASCIANNRGDALQVEEQGKRYKILGVPEFNDRIITSGVLMRQNTPTCIKLCEEWWAEVVAHSARDQIAFARISIGYKIHTFVWDYSQSKELSYKKHAKYK